MIDARYRTAAALALLTTLGTAPSAAEPVHGRWYSQPPWQNTGPGLYYSYHPEHVPGYPQEFRGYPVPLYSTSRPGIWRHAARDGSGWSAHIDWCQQRWRSYQASDNSYQPVYGPRRQCRSPFL
jgi:hypothetical protein